MKLFKCRNCGQILYFENTVCQKCGSALGYLWQQTNLGTLSPTTSNEWVVATAPGTVYRYCQNFEYGACNWLLPGFESETLCLACKLNRTIPDLSQSLYQEQWRKLELAKHRLVYSLLRLGLPVVNRQQDPNLGLSFDFLAEMVGEIDPESGQEKKVVTGHQDGVITINIAEADDAQREQMRQSLGEPYRTLMGHFRHEIAHYYWMHFAQSGQWLAAFRALFGDEQQDYSAALAQHYSQASNTEWQATYITAYAAAHPWEDWAESWAHYLHIVDTLETAYAFGMQVDPLITKDETLATDVTFDPYQSKDFERLIATWLPITFALNSLNRSMGLTDIYPFILTPPVLEKLAFIHNTIHNRP